MDDLYTIINNVDKDNTFEVIAVLKESPLEITEKVRALNGKEYIRKYFLEGGNFSKEKLAAVSKLNHPNLPNTHDYYELADRSVIIQDFISGRRLSEVIEEKGSLGINEIRDNVVMLCDAVECMHNQKSNPLIHRDIKPDNIIIEADNALKLIDFGAVREFKYESNKDTVNVGTPGYASPEQFGFGQTDERTDIYAIGMTIKHMLTGKAPEHGNIHESPEITNSFSSIIKKATEFDPEARYKNISELRNAIKSGSKPPDEKPSVQKPPIPRPPISKQASISPKKEQNKTKIGHVFLYILILLFFVSIIYNAIANPSGFGQKDDILEFGEMLTVVILLSSFLILGFNLFNINERLRFFSTKRKLKKAIISIIIFIIISIILVILQDLHSEAYKLANSATS